MVGMPAGLSTATRSSSCITTRTARGSGRGAATSTTSPSPSGSLPWRTRRRPTKTRPSAIASASAPARARTSATVAPSPGRTRIILPAIRRGPRAGASDGPHDAPGEAHAGAGSKVDRHSAGDETAARGVRGPSVGAGELGLRLRHAVGASADEAPEIEVKRERAAQADLESGADLAAEVGVVLVDRTRIRGDVRAGQTEPREEVKLGARLRVQEEEPVEGHGRLVSVVALVVGAADEIDVGLDAEVARGLEPQAEPTAAHRRVVRAVPDGGPFEVQIEAPLGALSVARVLRGRVVVRSRRVGAHDDHGGRRLIDHDRRRALGAGFVFRRLV